MKKRVIARLFVIAWMSLPYAAHAQNVVINEVMALNGHTLAGESGQYGDWVEIYNPTPRSIDVGGWYLTDDLGNPRLWQIPTDRSLMTTVPARGYLLVWMDEGTTGSALHASFKLGSDGDTLALFDKDGTTLIDKVVFGRQRVDISFGRDPTDTSRWRFLGVPSPGKVNAGAFLGEVADLRFSHLRGFYDVPFSLEITTDTPGTTIVYTTDGSLPCDTAEVFSPSAKVYTGPIPIATTSCIRAVGYQPGWLATPAETHTYIFLEDVRRQATNPTTGAQVVPPGCPTIWPGGKTTGAVTGDYQVDPDVVALNGKDKFQGLYSATFKDDMKAVPTVSLVMALDDWFGPTGIYINQSLDGTERACSIEWIEPNGAPGFQINCAMAMQGGVTGGGTSLSRWKIFKLSMRPRFKPTLDNGTPTGGPSGLDYPVFPDSPVTHYDTFVLDALLANTWNHSGQHNTPNYLEDQFTSDLHNAMGGQSPHGRFAHVYINGLYWGMYNLHERPDHAWAAEVFGGDKDQYDAIKHSSGMVVNSGAGGNATTNFNAMISAANAVAADPTSAAKYEALCSQLDVDNFITELLAHWFALNWDWPAKNWYATHLNTPDGKWRFHVWDAEHALEYWSSQNVLGLSESGIHDKLKVNAEYRMHFADLAHRFFFNGGVLSYPAVADRYRGRIAEIDRAIVGESARWGDTRASMPHTRAEWTVIEANILAQFIQPRPAFVLDWLKQNGLYPNAGAPVFNVKGAYQFSGHIGTTDAFSMTLPQGTTGKIYYTLDGTDPRQPAAGPSSQPEMTLVAASAPKRVLVPIAALTGPWTGGGAFNDSGWTLVTGSPGGVGYDTNPASGGDYSSSISYNVQSAMYGTGKGTSCYIRIPFTLSEADLQSITTMTLKMLYDDGFVAWLNGTEVARVGFTGTPAWNSVASASRDAGTTPTSYDIGGLLGELIAGSNILAIQAMNNAATSSDLLMLAELSAAKTGSAGSGPAIAASAVEYKGPFTLARSARVRARTFSNGTWSALNEAAYAAGPVAAGLRISEIMYHPQDPGNPDDPNTEFVELTNIGTQAIGLNLVRFTKGIDFTFDDVVLQSGAAILVVRDTAAFTAKYGQGLPVAGVYSGSLDNAGERVRLEDAVGQVIVDFEYKDGWYKTTDGGGYSLVLRQPQTADTSALSDKALWRASLVAGGSPGRSE